MSVSPNITANLYSTGFGSFGFDPAIDRGIRAAGFTTPRPIQAETIPAALEDRDVLGLAQTGTGKTAAFALPILDLILEARCRGPRALVIAPTRELATQIDAPRSGRSRSSPTSGASRSSAAWALGRRSRSCVADPTSSWPARVVCST